MMHIAGAILGLAGSATAIAGGLAGLLWRLWRLHATIREHGHSLRVNTRAHVRLAQSLDAFCDVILDHEVRLSRAEERLGVIPPK